MFVGLIEIVTRLVVRGHVHKGGGLVYLFDRCAEEDGDCRLRPSAPIQE